VKLFSDQRQAKKIAPFDLFSCEPADGAVKFAREVSDSFGRYNDMLAEAEYLQLLKQVSVDGFARLQLTAAGETFNGATLSRSSGGGGSLPSSSSAGVSEAPVDPRRRSNPGGAPGSISLADISGLAMK
jgi:hypothetical protein